MANTVHWFNHAGSTIRYELTHAKHPDVLIFRARVWRDDHYVGEVHDSVLRAHADVQRWSDSSAELLAVSHTEQKIRDLLGSLAEF